MALRFTAPPSRPAIVAIHFGDVIGATVLTLFTEEPSSPFFVLFGFTLLAAGYGIWVGPVGDAFCAWLQPLDPSTMQPAGMPPAVQHLHQPRLCAVAGAAVTNDVRGGYLYATLTETTGNIWMIAPTPETIDPSPCTTIRPHAS